MKRAMMFLLVLALTTLVGATVASAAFTWTDSAPNPPAYNGLWV